MKLSKRVKVLIGALTVWPFLCMFLIFGVAVFWWFWMGATDGVGSESATRRALPIVMIAVPFASILIMLGLELFYLLFLFRTHRVEQDKKALWAVVILLGAGLAMPVFFWIYVWPDTWPGDTLLSS